MNVPSLTPIAVRSEREGYTDEDFQKYREYVYSMFNPESNEYITDPLTISEWKEKNGSNPKH